MNVQITDSGIKGKLAEAIVEELFVAMDYTVMRFGVENIAPQFAKRINPYKGRIAELVRQTPDFLMIHDRKSFLVEVKYRTSGEFKPKDGYRYPEAIIVLVTPKYLKAQIAILKWRFPACPKI